MSKLSELLNKLDADTNVRGNQFEHICKWYFENDPKYALELKKVWLWDDWPGRWGPDAGIDIVAKTYDNKLWAVQAKAYNPDHSIRKADIDSFLSESSREVFSYRLLITTTSFIGRTAEQTIQAQEKAVGTVLLSDLEKSEIEWPDSPEKLQPKPVKKKKPFPHQEKAISDICQGFSINNRGQLIMACGTGKTLVALWIAEKLQCKRILILVPSLSLLAQTLREWTANTSQAFHYLPVCSDDTVRGADHFTSNTSALGLPVTTNPNEVAEFLRRRGPIIVFSTYQSSPVIAETFTRHNVPSFDLAIADEAHRCAGIGSGLFATILDSDVIKAKQRLFMTATPRYFTDNAIKQAKDIDLETASMDDESKFGKIFHQLTFSEAIRQKLLTDFQVLVIGVDNATYKQYAEYEKLVTTDGKETTDARTLASQIALIKAMKMYNLKRVISFHSKIKRAKQFSDQLPGVMQWMPNETRPTGSLWSDHVSGEMSSGKRDMRLNRFRHLEYGERGLLSNARCLGEGVDVPTLDGIAFIDPKYSQIDIIQAVGRAIRKSPEKKTSTIVVPVFIEEGEDAKTVLNNSTFKAVWKVLRALRAHDNLLADRLDMLRQQVGKELNAIAILPDKIVLDFPVTVGPDFAKSFALKVVERTTTAWIFWYGLLKQYTERNGHANVPAEYVTEDGYKLGLWVGAQRQTYNKGKLSKKKIESLEQLSGWVWSSRDAAWDEGFKRLCEYVKREGHTRIPPKYFTKDGYNLRGWVSTQRDFYSRGILYVERQQALEELPGWAWSSRDAAWDEGFKCLCEYVKHKGDSVVAYKYATADGYKLGLWVRAQRAAYNKGDLIKEKVEFFEQLPKWKWKYAPESDWNEKIQLLCEYTEREGHSNVPTIYVTEDGYKLGSWLRRQLVAYNKGNLSKKKIESLEQLPKWKWKYTPESDWNEKFQLLCEYTEREGHSNISSNYVTEDGYKLGSWVIRQRVVYNKGKLSKKKIESLEQLSGWVWSSRDAAWDDKYRLLREYTEREGHSNISSNYVAEDGYKLGSWVIRQRVVYNKGKLSKKKIESLEQLPKWKWKYTPESDWNEKFQLLCEYTEGEGHSNISSNYVTEDGYKLGSWVARQRVAYNKGKLSKKKIESLEQLPGWVRIYKSGDSKATSSVKWPEGFFQCLCEYVKDKGHSYVPVDYVTKDGYHLGRWVFKLRKVYEQGGLTKEQKNTLEKLAGWKWIAKDKNISLNTEQGWQEGYKRLVKFIEHEGHTEREGHSNVPTKYVTEDGYKLGLWVRRQRVAYNKGELIKKKIESFERLPGWKWKYKPRSARDAKLQLLREYTKREGHSNVPLIYVTEDGYKLGVWVRRQQTAYRKDFLSKEQIGSLEQLPGWVWESISRSAWNETFQLLREYAEREDHSNISSNYVTEDSYKLGQWVRRQQINYRIRKAVKETTRSS